MNRKRTGERGAMTIVEATFVFPITFFIVFFMIMAGEAFYLRACAEYYVTSTAISGAADCENPMLSAVVADGVPQNPAETEVMPYRYILTGNASDIATEVAGELEAKLESLQPLLFKRMKPAEVSVTIKPKVNVFVSSFPVECDFEVPLPIKMIFSDEKLSFKFHASATASIGDPAEFVRNVSIVSDLIERSAWGTEICQKIKAGMDKIGAYIN